MQQVFTEVQHSFCEEQGFSNGEQQSSGQEQQLHPPNKLPFSSEIPQHSAVSPLLAMYDRRIRTRMTTTK